MIYCKGCEGRLFSDKDHEIYQDENWHPACAKNELENCFEIINYALRKNVNPNSYAINFVLEYLGENF